MGDGSGDSQRVWHEFFGGYYHGVSILDAGAGFGRSRDRLAAGGNTVTTLDTERSRMEHVDLICDPRDLLDSWDVVTAFDVIEHVPNADEFLDVLRTRARRAVVITTPAYRLYPQPWHFTPDQIAAWADAWRYGPARWFARYKAGDEDRIEAIDRHRHLTDETIYAHGLELLIDG